MKSFIQLFILTILYTTCSAQTEIGLKAGYNRGTAKVTLNDVKQGNGYVNGYSVGLFFKAPFEAPLHFTPSISYTHRGYSYSADTGRLRVTGNEIDYLDIAPGFSVDLVNKKKTGLILGFSPSVSIAMSGKETRTFLNDSIASEKMKFSFAAYSIVDIGLNASIGFRFGKRIMLDVTGYMSVSNIDNLDENRRNIKARMLSVNLGYFLK